MLTCVPLQKHRLVSVIAKNDEMHAACKADQKLKASLQAKTNEGELVSHRAVQASCTALGADLLGVPQLRRTQTTSRPVSTSTQGPTMTTASKPCSCATACSRVGLLCSSWRPNTHTRSETCAVLQTTTPASAWRSCLQRKPALRAACCQADVRRVQEAFTFLRLDFGSKMAAFDSRAAQLRKELDATRKAHSEEVLLLPLLLLLLACSQPHALLAATRCTGSAG